MPTASERLRAEEVSVAYSGRQVVTSVSFDVGPGESVAVVGPNGAGKSTLLGAVTGVLHPSAGRVWLGSHRVDCLSRREIARRIAVVPQGLSVGFGLTVGQMVMLGRTARLSTLGVPTRHDREAVEVAMEDTETSTLAGRPVSTLSGGEAQRVILAMALAQETPYLVMDEPTAHLDLGQQWRFMRRLMELRRDRGVGILASLHDLSLAGSSFDRVILLSEGRLVASGSPAEVLTDTSVSVAFGAPVMVTKSAAGVRVVPQPVSVTGSVEEMWRMEDFRL